MSKILGDGKEMKRENLTAKDEIKFMTELFEKVIVPLKEKKTASYGGLRYYDLGLSGLAHDILRKTGRLEHMVVREGKIDYGVLEDTLVDIIVYSFMFLHELKLEEKE